MNKLCVIYNYAQHYRKEIFQLLDREFECDWYFGDSMGDVKKLDYSLLKGNVQEVHNSRVGKFILQRGIHRLLKKYDVFLMIGESWNLSVWRFCIQSKFFKNKRIYFWSHGWYGKETTLESFLKRRLNNMATGIFLYGDYAKELMLKEGFSPNKLHVIYNSLDYSNQIKVRDQLKSSSIYSDHFKNNNPNLFFVGRLTPVKKLDMILRALDAERKKGKYFNMTFIGSGEVKEELVNLTTTLGLSDNVWFYGPSYDEKELGNLIYNADLCVAPGNIGLTAMHSLVFGTPAITHNSFKWQMPEFEAIKDGVTGSFFEKDDVDSLAIHIESWFKLKGQFREQVRKDCMAEIDQKWNPQFQIEVFKKYIK